MTPLNRPLVMDDEPDIAHQTGLEVLAVSSTDEFERAIGKFDQTNIYLGFNMSGVGLEAVEHLAATNHRGSIVLMGGSDPRYIQMSSTVANTRGLPVAGILPKPFRMKQLVDILKALI